MPYRRRILYIASSTIPSRYANSINVMKMCQAFAKLGHEVRVIAHASNEGYKDDEEIFEYYNVQKIFGLRLKRVPKVRGSAALYAVQVAEEIARYNPDIVYSRDILGARTATLLGIPTYFEAHHPLVDERWPFPSVFRSLVRSKNFVRLVVITDALRRNMEATHDELVGLDIQVAPDGADPVTQVHGTAIKSDDQNRRLQVGYVGSLYPGKGMEIVGPLAADCPWADFHVVGGPQDLVHVWKRQSSDIPNLHFHGQVAHSEVPKYMSGFDVGLLPNQAKVIAAGRDIGQWTSPLKAFEYAATGLAILASDLPVLREVLEHNVNALLCQAEDPQSWRTNLETLRENAALRKELGETAKDIFLSRHTWLARARRVIEV